MIQKINPGRGINIDLNYLIQEYYVARKSYQVQMRGLQIYELFFQAQQKEAQGKIGAEKILQEMPQAHASQRSEIVLAGIECGLS